MDPIYKRKGRAGATFTLTPIEDDDGADYRTKIDRPGLASMSIAWTNTEFDELVAARDTHRDAT